jgi:uncharacterized repeat protein (TIGR01451 family)
MSRTTQTSVTAGIFLITFLLLIAPAIAEGELLEKDWIYQDQTITIDNYSYIVNTNVDNDAIIIELSTNDFEVIEFESCKNIYSTRVCFENKRNDHDEDRYEFLIATYNIQSKVNAKHSFETAYFDTRDKTFLVGQEIEITTTIRNDGVHDAKETVYHLNVPDAFMVTDAEDAEHTMHSIRWEGELESGQTETFSYTVIPKESYEGSFRSKISYIDASRGNVRETLIDGFGDLLEFTIEDRIATEHTYLRGYQTENTIPELDFDEEPDELIVGETFYYIIKLENNKFSDHIYRAYDTSASIILPPSVSFVDGKTIRIQDETGNIQSIGTNKISRRQKGIYEWNGNVSQTEPTYIVLALKGAESSKEQIFTDISYMMRQYEKKEDLPFEWQTESRYTQDFSIRNFDIHVSSLTDDEDRKYDSEQDIHFRYSIQNANPDISYYDVSVSFNTSFFNASDAHLDTIGPDEFVTLFDEYLETPLIIDKDKRIPVTLNISYATDRGERFNQTYEEEVFIAAVDPLSVSYDFDESKINSQEDVRVEVQIENKRFINIQNVTVTDTLPDDFTLLNGTATRSMPLNKDSDTTVYTYLFKAPVVEDDDDPKTYTIKTYTEYTYKDKRYNTTGEKSIKVYPKDSKIDIEKELVYDFSFFRGQTIDIKYTLENTEDEILTNIRLLLPVQPEVDSVFKDNRRSITISKLNPQETITLNGYESIILKDADTSFYLKPTKVTYYDEKAQYYNDTSSKVRISSVDEDIVKKPLIILNKTITEVPNSTDFNVTLQSHNVGESTTTVRIYEPLAEQEENTFTQRICGGCTTNLSFRITEQTLRAASENDELHSEFEYVVGSSKRVSESKNSYSTVTEYLIDNDVRLEEDEPKRVIKKKPQTKPEIEQPTTQNQEIPSSIIASAIIIFIFVAILIIKSVNIDKKPKRIDDVIEGLK